MDAYVDQLARTGQLAKSRPNGRSAVVLQLQDKKLLAAIDERMKDAPAAEYCNLSRARHALTRRMIDREMRVSRRLAKGAVL